jgi:molybdenum cofactor cytidylyltransferase
VDALSPECAAFVVALGDQPWIDPALVGALRAAWEGSNAAAVVPVFRGGIRGHPVLFDRSTLPFIRQLRGDKGARELLDAMADRVLFQPVDADAPLDVDTPGDLAALER